MQCLDEKFLPQNDDHVNTDCLEANRRKKCCRTKSQNSLYILVKRKQLTTVVFFAGMIVTL